MQDRTEKAENKGKKYFFSFKFKDWMHEYYCVSFPDNLETIKKWAQYWSRVDTVVGEIKIIELQMPEKDFLKLLPFTSYLSKECAEKILSKNENYEIKKNMQTLASLCNDRNSFFSTLPTETLIKIASLMGNDPNVIEEDNKAYEIALKNFNIRI